MRMKFDYVHLLKSFELTLLQDSDDGSDGEASGSEDETSKVDISQFTFGALAKAQEALSKQNKDSDDSSSESDPDDDRKKKDGKDKNKSDRKIPKRSNKHAPVEMSAKKPVSRKRDFLTVTAELKKPKPRDPRFLPIPGTRGSGNPTIEEIKARKRYAFLDEYRESEMQQLREAIAKTKDAAAKEKLQRALMSMESKKKAQERKDKEREILAEHKKREKELIKKGKKPFYLKRSEQKKRLLVEQYQGMKKKQVDKAIERRMKKIAAKERKLLPTERRGREDR